MAAASTVAIPGSLGSAADLRRPSCRSSSRTTSLRITGRFERPLEEIYNVRVERGVSKARLEELEVERWSTWRTGRCRLPWDCHVDQQVYVVRGEVRVVPEGAKSGDRHMRFVAGDLLRYPKWFEADLFFDGPYEERYKKVIAFASKAHFGQLRKTGEACHALHSYMRFFSCIGSI